MVTEHAIRTLCLLAAAMLATSAHAQNVVGEATAAEVSNDCAHLPGRDLWRAANESAPPGLRQRTPTSPDVDRSTASDFEASRDLGDARGVELAVCSGAIRLAPVNRANQLHLTITLRRELPKGITVGTYIQEFAVGAAGARIFIKVPKRYEPEVVLEVPNGTDTAVDLGYGTVRCSNLAGNKTIRIAQGELTLAGDIDSQYGLMRASFGIGGVRDKRASSSAGVQKVHGWHYLGHGRYTLVAGFGSGYLNLLAKGEF